MTFRKNQQADAFERGLKKLGYDFDFMAAHKNSPKIYDVSGGSLRRYKDSTYFTVEIPGDSLKIRFSNHAQVAGGGWCGADGDPDGGRAGEADFSCDPETGKNFRDALDFVCEKIEQARLELAFEKRQEPDMLDYAEGF